MIGSSAHFPEPVSAAALANVGRLVRTILCLAGISLLVVVLRYGIYEYFHGDGRMLVSALDAIRR
jgi:hypothetical protein